MNNNMNDSGPMNNSRNGPQNVDLGALLNMFRNNGGNQGNIPSIFDINNGGGNFNRNGNFNDNFHVSTKID
jgi:hypothetical protein